MKILHTNKGKEVYVDDDVAERIKGKTLVENKTGTTVSVLLSGKPCSLGRLALDYTGTSAVKRIDKTNFNYQRSNLSNKSRLAVGIFDNIPYNGVVPTKVRNVTYALAYYYNSDNKKTTLGYFYTPYDAAVIREYTIRKNGIDTVQTNISLDDRELESEYAKAVLRTERIKRENIQRRTESFTELIKQRMVENDKYGIYERDNKAFTIQLRVNGRNKTIGSFQTYKDAAIVRNCYIIENKLSHNLCPLDMPIEEQMRLSKSIKTIGQIRKGMQGIKTKPKKGYKGINTLRDDYGERYQVLIRVGDERKYVGGSRDKDMAAMMYNIYVIEKGLAKEIINDVGISLAEQKHLLTLDGYEFNGERFSKRDNKQHRINIRRTKMDGITQGI